MSNLRIAGLMIGILGLFLSFRIYRGPRWNRLNFLLSGIASVFLIAISLNPNFLNTVTGMLALQQEHRGRILTLLIFSNILWWFLLLYLKTRLDKHRYQFDLLIRNLAQEETEHELEEETKNKEIMVIIPAYNEAGNLKDLLPRIPARIADKEIGVLVIDDGSSDNTAEVVKKMGYLCIRNKINRGQGAASRLGYDVLLKYNVKIGVTMDSDNQHLPEDIEKLVRPILEGKCDLVIGSRILGKREKGSFLREVGILFFSKSINLLTGLKLSDCSSGFKAFDMGQTRKLKLMEDQFQSAEVIIEAAKRGLRIGEVPITLVHRKYGKSKKGKDWQYGFNFAKTILKTWWR